MQNSLCNPYRANVAEEGRIFCVLDINLFVLNACLISPGKKPCHSSMLG